MIRAKEFILSLYKKMFTEPSKEVKSRRLVINQETGELNWSKGEMPFGEGPSEEEIEKAGDGGFRFEDNKEKGTRMFRPTPSSYEPYRKSRFEVEFPGIPAYFFQSYSYMGTDVNSKKRLFTNEVIKDDYSSFKVLMLFPHEIDICEKLKELEESPNFGTANIHLLDPTGVIVKTIVVPDCEVTEIKVFRDLNYGSCGDKNDELMVGEIIVKHKQRRLI